MQLSVPFDVNASFVLNAYLGFARDTGCRPGMVVNDKRDAMDEAGHWFEVPPLEMGALALCADAAFGAKGVEMDGGFEARCRMEVTFARKKGECVGGHYFGSAGGRGGVGAAEGGRARCFRS